MTTPKQALIDTNVLVALVDTRDTWHARAQAVREALKTTATSLIYWETVLNETPSGLARRAHEQRRADQFAGLVHTLGRGQDGLCRGRGSGDRPAAPAGARGLSHAQAAIPAR